MGKTIWAPCIHSPEDRGTVRKWLHEVLDDSDWFAPLNPEDDSLSDSELFSLTERALHEIALLPMKLRLSFVSDQWIQITAYGTVDGIEYITKVEADYFMLALVKTYELWKTGAYKEVHE